MPMPRAPYVTLTASSALLLLTGPAVIGRYADGGMVPAAPRVTRAIPRPQPHWSPATLRQLLAAVDASRDEGLHPQDYQRDELTEAAETGRSGPAVAALATLSARALARDYAEGRIRHHERFGWHIDHPTIVVRALEDDVARAVNRQALAAYLDGLLPKDPRYAALRSALRDTPSDEEKRVGHIRASMERWRWMPRTLGNDYIWVNVPTYRLALYEGDAAVATHDVVVGARQTPTPLISAHIGSIIVNPWWTLPPTVMVEGKVRPGPGARSKGYVFGRTGDGRPRIRQRPGPTNSLGRLKIDMPNAYAIYLHDTPAKALFEKQERALSHGCIRVKDIAELADRLIDPADIDKAMASTTTRTFQMGKTIPIYIVYFTAAPDPVGKVSIYDDPYDQDEALIAALDHKHSASRSLASHVS
ncbi:MAG TPA: L,D-transpeptidase family protein [Sphingomonas sp.]|nr:L,D-transpeptidase family protein [Sphingomonas sp.]